MKKYHHTGVPTDVPRGGESYHAGMKFHHTDYRDDPYGIEWMRFEPGCPVPDIVKEVSHIAFEVDDLEAALEGKEVIIEPNRPSGGVRVAFILHGGVPVEFLCYDKK